MTIKILIVLALILPGLCFPASYSSNPFSSSLHSVSPRGNSDDELIVDLGYAVYKGAVEEENGINNWLGMRYATPPTGSNRWQPPKAPVVNRSAVLPAEEYGSGCYQAVDAIHEINHVSQEGASEDCLFINVWAPPNITEPLPVFVLFHGGGYGAGAGSNPLSYLINTNNGSFVGVGMNFRLGAFGFLSSDEVYERGTPNAGIYDQHMALQWVQTYIHLFGGDASRVTIGGFSAGGGSAMLHSLAYDGTMGQTLFRNSFVASPYLPMQFEYNSWVPTQAYYAFATLAGCPPSMPYGRQKAQGIFDCLQAVDADKIANASAILAQSGIYGTWSFAPVTDRALVTGRPSEQLLKRKLNGLNTLVGHTANEGAPFVPQNITTDEEFEAWLDNALPLFTPSDIEKVLLYYPKGQGSGTDYATSGHSGPTANSQSSVATGLQARANNIYGEMTFVCPAYWIAEAYSSSVPDGGVPRKAFKYQYSVPPALHGADGNAALYAPSGNIGEDLSMAYKAILGNFITRDDPSIPVQLAVGEDDKPHGEEGQVGDGFKEIANWPLYTIARPYQFSFNQTGGEAMEIPLDDEGVNVTTYVPPGVSNSFGLFDAYIWEGGRGFRCDFWRSMASRVPA
ncbi:carboxylesterase family protein [Sarocladium implicatum]|nr:carboxylesterase family protein [Sarocladium implicatum]